MPRDDANPRHSIGHFDAFEKRVIRILIRSSTNLRQRVLQTLRSRFAVPGQFVRNRARGRYSSQARPTLLSRILRGSSGASSNSDICSSNTSCPVSSPVALLSSGLRSVPVARNFIFFPSVFRMRKTSSDRSLTMFMTLDWVLLRLTWMSRLRVPVSTSLRRAVSSCASNCFMTGSDDAWVSILAACPFRYTKE